VTAQATEACGECLAIDAETGGRFARIGGVEQDEQCVALGG